MTTDELMPAKPELMTAIAKASASKSREQRLYDALNCIARGYETVSQIRKNHENWGLDYTEALEMAYENLQIAAKNAIHRMRRPK
jgi:hypothetical protein